MENFLSGRSFGNTDRPTVGREPMGGFQPLFAKPALPAIPDETTIDCQKETQPQLEIVNGKNGVERIIVICTCGKRIEVNCEYE